MSGCQGLGMDITIKGSTRDLCVAGSFCILIVDIPTYTHDKTASTTQHTNGCMSNW